MLLCCIAAVLCAAACSAVDDSAWYRTAHLYEVFPRSYKDTDGNGIGDLKGVTENADHFKDIGVDAIWLCPIYKSPMVDSGYDISNFTAIDPLFGTMDDFDAMVKKLKSIGIKLLLDFVPNHTSDEHEWFQKSLDNKTNPDYSEFYVWKEARGWNGTTPIPPNNWVSVFGGSMWEWRQERQQFYLHQYSKKQPDLNYRNPNVWGNITDILSFWIDRGVDGLRMDAVKHIYENASFPDDPAVPGTKGDTYQTQQHIYDLNQPENYELVRHWAEVAQKKDQEDGKKRVFFIEAYSPHNVVMKYYTVANNSMVIPFNFDLLYTEGQATRAPDLKAVIDSWMKDMPEGYAANWVVGSHDKMRVGTHYGPEMVDSINLLTGVLPGIMVTYNGDEIGMLDTYVRPDQTTDPRDPSRSPMQWDSTPTAGFSTNLTTFLPVNPNYWWLNVEAQKAAPTSHLKVFQAIASARKDIVLQKGDVNIITPNNDTLVVVRSYNASYFVLVVNMGSDMMTYSSENLFAPYKLDMNMTVVVGSDNSDYHAGTTMKQGSISLSLRPKASVLLSSSPRGVPSSSDITRPFTLGSLLVVLVAIFTRS